MHWWLGPEHGCAAVTSVLSGTSSSCKTETQFLLAAPTAQPPGAPSHVCLRVQLLGASREWNHMALVLCLGSVRDVLPGPFSPWSWVHSHQAVKRMDLRPQPLILGLGPQSRLSVSGRAAPTSAMVPSRHRLLLSSLWPSRSWPQGKG